MTEESTQPYKGFFQPALFLVIGLLLGGLTVYSYTMLQNPGEDSTNNHSDICATPGDTLNNNDLNDDLNDDGLVDRAILFLNKEFLEKQSLEARLDNVTQSGLRIVSFSIFAGDQNIDSYKAYLTDDGGLILANPIDISNYTPSETVELSDYPKSDKPDVKLFVMSFCPFGQQAEAGLKPVAELLGKSANIEPHFVIYSRYADGGPDYCMDNGTYCSMHGMAELVEDIRQLCVWKYQKDKWWAYVDYINKNCALSNIEECWKSAADATGIDKDQIATCAKNEALELLEAELKLNTEYGVTGSPTVLINDVGYSGSRTPEAYKKAICSAYNNPPAECETPLGASSSSTASGRCD